MDDPIVRRIADPVHGSIGLTKLECQILDSPSFQRLRRIKHLGLAFQVFPSADFSRFAHSIGVCHVVGRLLDALALVSSDSQITADDKKLSRLAGLLHDAGHYPISHALEGPIREFYGKQDAGDALSDTNAKRQSGTGLKHEDVSALVVERDKEIVTALRAHGISPESVSKLFTRRAQQGSSVVGRVDPLANLVSSDLDADRIDYLQRTSNHTGLPYGAVDFDYLLSQIAFDDEDRICLNERALKTADHFLLSRYFDAQQVAFHKTVAGLELILKQVVKELLEKEEIRLDQEQLEAWIDSGEWSTIDDNWLDQKLRSALERGNISQAGKLKIRSVLRRTPPKLIWKWEEILSTDAEGGNSRKGTIEKFLNAEKRAHQRVEKASEEFKIDAERFCVWSLPPFRLTKIESRNRQGLIDEEESFEGESIGELEKQRNMLDQLIRIKKNGQSSSQPITTIKSSLMSVLDNQALASVRIYLVVDPDQVDDIERIRKYLEK